MSREESTYVMQGHCWSILISNSSDNRELFDAIYHHAFFPAGAE